MNKQEAIKYINELPILISSKESGNNAMISKYAVLELVSQIGGPQKVVIPKFVAEWIEQNREKEHLSMFWKIVAKWETSGEIIENREVYEWYIDFHEKDFIFALVLGYEVEKEKLYTVEIPDPNSKYDHRFLRKGGRGVSMDASDDDRWKNYKCNQLTEAEIKEDFEWAWDAGFAKEVIE